MGAATPPHDADGFVSGKIRAIARVGTRQM